MAQSPASKAHSAHYCNESDAVVELCTNCPYDDCLSPDSGCDEMRKLKKALREGQEYHPPENWGPQADPDPQALLDAAWKKLEKQKPEKPPREPSIMIEELPQPDIQHLNLHRYNEAIRALELLHDVATGIGPAITQAILTIRNNRAVRFDHLIDWDAVARGGNK